MTLSINLADIAVLLSACTAIIYLGVAVLNARNTNAQGKRLEVNHDILINQGRILEELQKASEERSKFWDQADASLNRIVELSEQNILLEERVKTLTEHRELEWNEIHGWPTPPEPKR